MALAHVLMGADAFRAPPAVRTIRLADLKDALRAASTISPPCRPTRCSCA